ncbi:chloride channel CLIC-like protein 1 isoform X2 [Gouania willdenowi]|uniref:chloride channel CLIC-like protein 1 isoform X2 n=1 Tax=Gouania willdenowi TaxID=441366 RepID=UPI001054FC8F|nr:chloride channel CLIC-like protein 1 isoform X2 [Gouania willdenowi]
MILPLLVCCLSVSVVAQQANHDWVDPYDMINYDANTKTMRKPVQPSSHDKKPTNQANEERNPFDRINYDSSTGTMRETTQIEDQKKTNFVYSQESTCNPVFKRFLRRLLKEITRVGLPSDSTEVIYDTKIKLSKQAVTEIQSFLEGEDGSKTGALDSAISQLLVDLKLHDHVTVIWRFEDTFGVELDTVIKIMLFILLVVVIVCTNLWSTISWFMCFRRLFAVCVFVSIIWNWFYLYKIAFAEHQNNLVKMDSFNAKCTGVKRIDWSDSLKEWLRSTWTLQGDPCQKYYEVLMVNPVLLVPPTKAISVTFTTFFTEPLKHIGQGISEFLRALLKDLPVTLQIPVLIVISIAIVICVYVSVQSTFQYGIRAPLRRPGGDPPPQVLEQPPPQRLGIEQVHNVAGGDGQAHQPVNINAHNPAQIQAPQHHTSDNGQLPKIQVHQMRPLSARPEVETLRRAEDGTDAKRRGKKLQNLNVPTVPDSENQQETEQLEGATAGRVAADTVKTKSNESDTSESNKKAKEDETKLPQDEPSINGAEGKQTQSEVQLGASNNQVETVGTSVEETAPEP